MLSLKNKIKMNSKVFKQQIETNFFLKLANMITLKTAQKLLQNDPIMFQLRISEMCRPNLYNFEKYKKLQFKITDEKFIVYSGDCVVFRYIHYFDLTSVFLLRDHDDMRQVNANMNSICWLESNECPIKSTPKFVYREIGKYLSVDDKRNVCLVSKFYNREYSKDIHWEMYLKSISGDIFDDYSFKQQVMRYLLYIDLESLRSLLKIEEYGRYFAQVIGAEYYLTYFRTIWIGNIKYEAQCLVYPINIWIDVMDNLRIQHESLTEIPKYIQRILKIHQRSFNFII